MPLILNNTTLSIDPTEKVHRHVDAVFGAGVSAALPADLQFEFSKRTGRIKNFSVDGRLVATLRTDGGLALTVFGAQYLLDRNNDNNQFRENCVIPVQDAIPFVSEGRSLFCKHVKWCGSNIKVGSDVAVIDDSSGNNNNKVIAVGIAVLPSKLMKQYNRGVAVKVREGIAPRRNKR